MPYKKLDRKYRQRLQKLADFMETLPKRKLTMGVWAASKSQADFTLKADETLYHRRGVLINDKINPRLFYIYTPDVKDLGLRAKGEWGDVCNTTMCIAGWTCFLFPRLVDRDVSIEDNARAILGLSYSSGGLFYDFSLTPKSAAAKLRKIAEEPQYLRED